MRDGVEKDGSGEARIVGMWALYIFDRNYSQYACKLHADAAIAECRMNLGLTASSPFVDFLFLLVPVLQAQRELPAHRLAEVRALREDSSKYVSQSRIRARTASSSIAVSSQSQLTTPSP